MLKFRDGRRARAPRAGQRGSFVIETMIGLTIGLIVLAGTMAMFAGTQRKSASVVGTSRLNSELRATMDLIVRELRRAGYWGGNATGVWSNANPNVSSSPFAALDTSVPGRITYRYDVNGNGAVDSGEVFRISRDSSSGGVSFATLDGNGNAVSANPFSDNDLTNISALTFTVTDRTATTTCRKSGAGPVAPTPPVLHVQLVNVSMTGALRSAPTQTRTLTQSVQVRNDRIEGSCPP